MPAFFVAGPSLPYLPGHRPDEDSAQHTCVTRSQFYFPRVHAQIDWGDAPVFLDQELRAVVQDAELGNRFVDKLVRIRRKDGCRGWLYVHMEVQGEVQKAFSERMSITTDCTIATGSRLSALHYLLTTWRIGDLIILVTR
jgi:hypothetical protein